METNHGSAQMRRCDFSLVDVDSRQHDSRRHACNDAADEEKRNLIGACLEDSANKTDDAADLDSALTAESICKQTNKG